MTDRRSFGGDGLTRRDALRVGGVAALGASLSGCGGRTRRSYWDDPPSFDATGLDDATDEPVPDRPDPMPVRLPDERVAALSDRVGTLLAPIPDPLTPETVPNGAIRTEIVEARDGAREARRRMRTLRGDAPTLSVVEAGVDACARAARAAGCWAAIHADRDPDAVTLSRSAALGRMDDLGNALPDAATDPHAGVVAYAPPERWADVTRRRRLVTPEAPSTAANPLRAGRATCDLERTRAQAAVGTDLRERYVASLSDPVAVAESMRAALSALAPRVEDRFRAMHEGETERPQSYPDVDAYLSRDVPRDHPGRRLLSNAFGDFFDFARFAPVAWPSFDSPHPAWTLRATHRSLATLTAFDAIRARIDDGDDLFPADAAAVADAREAALSAVRALAESGAPLDRWTAWRLTPAFSSPDETFATETDPDRRAVAEAFGEYVRIEAVARATPDATATVVDALGD
ncbi:hypothetical protein [Haloparvum sedimenti]|uniref:hypothetical protein n=1 Tax=Haloparvum sedimenti TaxID=1678448 RepID=UPI00071E7142|nr:hypothetical protein [Haloparvum sedimenti]